MPRVTRASQPVAAGSGPYERCSWYTPGTGTFLAGDGAEPTIGEVGQEERVPEYRVEMVVPEESARVGASPRSATAHPYEEVAGRRDPAARAVKGPALHGRRRARQPRPCRVRVRARGRARRSSWRRTARRSGTATNNVAEYRALVEGLRKAAVARRQRARSCLRLRADGQADARRVPDQERGAARIVRGRCRGPRRRSGEVRYTAVRREHNELADRLVNEALDAAG